MHDYSQTRTRQITHDPDMNRELDTSHLHLIALRQKTDKLEDKINQLGDKLDALIEQLSVEGR